MKFLRKKAKGFIALIMTLAMLAGICLPVGALGISQNDSVNTDELAYSLTYEDGKAVLRVNPETVYRILKDKDISKDELRALIPSEILDTLSKGKDVTLDELIELASNYVTPSELKAIIGDLPEDIVAEYLALESLEQLISIEEMLALLPLDDIIDAASGEAMKILLTEEVQKLLFKQDIVDKLATEQFAKKVVGNDALLERITTDPVIKARLAALVTDEVVEAMLADKDIKARLDKELEGLKDKLDYNELLAKDGVLDSVLAIVLDDSHKKELDTFISNTDVQSALIDAIDADTLVKEIVPALVDSEVFRTNVQDIIALFDGSFDTLIDESALTKEFLQKFVNDANFADAAIKHDEIKNLIIEDLEFVKQLLDSKVEGTEQTIKDKHFEPMTLYKNGVIHYDELKELKAIDNDKLVAYLAKSNIHLDTLTNNGIITIPDTLDTEALEESELFKYFNGNASNEQKGELAQLTDEQAAVSYLFDWYVANGETDLFFENIQKIDGVTVNEPADVKAIEDLRINVDDFVKNVIDVSHLTVEILFEHEVIHGEFVKYATSEAVFKDIEESSEACAKVLDRLYTSFTNGTLKMELFIDIILEENVDVSARLVEVFNYKHPTSGATLINSTALSALLAENNGELLEKVIGKLGASNVVDALSTETLKSLAKNGNIFENKACIDAFIAAYSPLTDAALRTIVVDALGGYAAVVDKYIDIKVLVENVITVERLFDFFAPADLVDAVGIDVLLEYIDIKAIISELGGPAELVRLYSADELKAIFKQIGVDNLKAFITDSGILDAIDLRAIATDVIDYAKSKAPDLKAFIKEAAYKTFNILVTRVDSIKFNGVEFFNGMQFDINALLVAVLRAIPDMPDFLAIEKDGLVFGAVLTFDIKYGEDIVPYSYGFEAYFEGDPANLQSLVERFEDNFVLDVSDDLDITLTLGLPEAAAGIYETVLTTEKLPTELREQLVRLPDMTVSEAVELIRKIAENEKTFEAINEKLDEIKQKAYDKIDGKMGTGAKARISTDSAIETAKAKIDEYLDKFVTKENYDKAVAKMMSVLDKVAARVGGAEPVQSLYEGNGAFGFNKGISIDFIEAVKNVISIPDELAALFKPTEISASVDATVGVPGIYELTVVDKYGEEFVTYLPEGIDLEVLTDATGMSVIDENAQPVNAMPAADVSLNSSDRYYVVFKTPAGVVSTVFYNIGETSVNAPDLSTLTWDGRDDANYTYAWSTYELGKTQKTEVEVVETEIEQPEPTVTKPVYDENGNLIGDVTFPENATDDDIIDAIRDQYPDAFPDKKGYDTVITKDDDRITVTYRARKLSITFKVDGNTVKTVDDVWDYGTSLEDILKAIRDDANNDNKYGLKRDGYTISAIKGYVLNGEESQEVTVEYNGNIYYVIWYTTDGTKDVELDRVSWTFGDSSTYPTAHTAKVPTHPNGYTFKEWNPKELSTSLFATVPANGESIDVKAVWNEPVTPPSNDIAVTFVDADGKTLGTHTFQKGTEASEVLDYVNKNFARLGYEAKIDGYDKNGAEAQTVTVRYTAIVYTATFIADGEVVGTVDFTVESSYPLEGAPAVPAKAGYTGAWEKYEIGAGDIEIHAVYTPVDSAADTTDAPADTEDDDDDDKGFWAKYWPWILLLIIIILLTSAFVAYMSFKPLDDAPAPAPTPEPEPEPEPEVVPEAHAEPVIIIPPVVDSVSAEDVDAMMTDEAAMTLIAKKTVKFAPGKKAIVNVDAINSAFSAGDTVDLAALKAKKLVPQSAQRVKILADGNLDKALNIEAEAFSVQAVKMITLTGGTVTQIVSE